jgi:hypothetical protein
MPMMRRCCLTGFTLVLAALAVRAEPPSLKIDSEHRPTGQYVRFTPDTDAKSVIYVGLDGIDPFPSEELKDSRRFLLNTRGLAPGRYRFAAVAAGATGEQTRADFAVMIGPVPDPDRPVKPEDGKLGLVKSSREGLGRVNAPPAAEIKALAGKNRSLASAIVAGGVVDPATGQFSPAAALEAWRKGNREAVVDRTLWEPWGKAVSAALEALHSAGKLPDKAAWAAAFNEIADGLGGN